MKLKKFSQLFKKVQIKLTILNKKFKNIKISLFNKTGMKLINRKIRPFINLILKNIVQNNKEKFLKQI